MNDILIIGCGGLAKEAAQYIDDINRVSPKWKLLGYCTEDECMLGLRFGDYEVIMTDNDLMLNKTQLNILIGNGLPKVKMKIHHKLSNSDKMFFPNVIHPQSYVATNIANSCGNIVAPGAVISVDVEIGNHNLFNYNCTMGHDVEIGDYNVFNPSCNVSGNTVIGSGVLVGVGAQILQGLSVCDNVIIGAGAVVTKSIATPGVYVGVPAKLKKITF